MDPLYVEKKIDLPAQEDKYFDPGNASKRVTNSRLPWLAEG
jgi:hypothetical protein